MLPGFSPLSLPLSAPETPPPDLNSEEYQFMNGIGCLFPHMLLRRASTLTVESEATEAPNTPGRAPTPDALETPRVNASATFQTPTLMMPTIDTIFSHLNPLTPSPTPARKRALSSPPSAPRPKRHRFQAREANNHPEDEGYSETYLQEAPSAQSRRHIRQRAIDLAASVGIEVPAKDEDVPAGNGKLNVQTPRIAHR